LAILAGCQPAPAADTAPLKIAALPILDLLPVYAAQEGGFFEKQGVKVEFITAGSAAERDQIIAAGQADGMVNDLLSVALYNRKEIQVQVVRFAHLTAPGAPLYRILASSQSGITNVQGLAGVEIAISQGSIIDFATSYILTRQGLAADQIKTVAVPKIPDRLALLATGQLKAATLPEPFATAAIQQGARVIVDDTAYPEIANSVISFRKKVVDERRPAVKNFLTAVNQAVNDINTNPEKYRKLLDQYKLVPANLVQSYPIPKFPAAAIPTQAQFDLAVQWALGRGLIDQKVDFAQSVINP
jgi:NitT/TauT family transport system substrate-binding protein